MSNVYNRFSKRNVDSPLASLSENPFQFASFIYPEDIENLSHAMLFNINVQDSSKDFVSGRETAGTIEGGAGNNRGRSNISTQGLPGLVRRTTRVQRAIALYVPETLVFDNRQDFQTPSLMDMGLGGALLAIGASQGLNAASSPGSGPGGVLTGGVAALGIGALAGMALSPTLSQYAPNVVRQIFSEDKAITNAARKTAPLAGYAVNPIIEVLYSSPQLRTFNFDFNFIAKTPSEADQIWKIIYEFRRHSAPEFAQVSAGIFMVPPSDFDITFLRKQNGTFIENTNIPRMSTCVLRDVQLDYAASGQFVTFSDGMPVQIRMRLEFLEVNLITRERVDEGY